MLGDLTEQSASYIAGYVTKKMTRKDDERLNGRLPEFARMSNRPGIGLGMMDEIASDILKSGMEDRLEDVPTAISYGGRNLPLGPYLRRALRLRIGRARNTPDHLRKMDRKELQKLREIAIHYSLNIPQSKAKKDEWKIRKLESYQRRKEKDGL